MSAAVAAVSPAQVRVLVWGERDAEAGHRPPEAELCVESGALKEAFSLIAAAQRKA